MILYLQLKSHFNSSSLYFLLKGQKLILTSVPPRKWRLRLFIIIIVIIVYPVQFSDEVEFSSAINRINKSVKSWSVSESVYFDYQISFSKHHFYRYCFSAWRHMSVVSFFYSVHHHAVIVSSIIDKLCYLKGLMMAASVTEGDCLRNTLNNYYLCKHS